VPCCAVLCRLYGCHQAPWLAESGQEAGAWLVLSMVVALLAVAMMTVPSSTAVAVGGGAQTLLLCEALLLPLCVQHPPSLSSCSAHC
jgi:hypothetical protein